MPSEVVVAVSKVLCSYGQFCPSGLCLLLLHCTLTCGDSGGVGHSGRNPECLTSAKATNCHIVFSKPSLEWIRDNWG